MEWQGKLLEPVDKQKETNPSRDAFRIFYANYDSMSDKFYLILSGLYDDTHIYWASRHALSNEDKIERQVPVTRLEMQSVDSSDRHFFSLTIDSERRILYACACDRDISIWMLEGYDVVKAFLVGTIECQADPGKPVNPRFCDFFITSTSNLRRSSVMSVLTNDDPSLSNQNGETSPRTTSPTDHKMLILAVSDYINNTVSLFGVDADAFHSHLEQCQEEQDPRHILPSKMPLFVKCYVFANYTDRLKRHVMNGPCEVAFDPVGNLLVADKNHDRLVVS